MFRVRLCGILDRAAEQREGTALRFLIDLQQPERLADAMGDQVPVGRGLTFVDAFGDHLDRFDLGHYTVLRTCGRLVETAASPVSDDSFYS